MQGEMPQAVVDGFQWIIMAINLAITLALGLRAIMQMADDDDS